MCTVSIMESADYTQGFVLWLVWEQPFSLLFPDSGLKWKRSKRAMTVWNVKPTDSSHLFENGPLVYVLSFGYESPVLNNVHRIVLKLLTRYSRAYMVSNFSSTIKIYKYVKYLFNHFRGQK